MTSSRKQASAASARDDRCNFLSSDFFGGATLTDLHRSVSGKLPRYNLLEHVFLSRFPAYSIFELLLSTVQITIHQSYFKILCKPGCGIKGSLNHKLAVRIACAHFLSPVDRRFAVDCMYRAHKMALADGIRRAQTCKHIRVWAVYESQHRFSIYVAQFSMFAREQAHQFDRCQWCRSRTTQLTLQHLPIQQSGFIAGIADDCAPLLRLTDPFEYAPEYFILNTALLPFFPGCYPDQFPVSGKRRVPIRFVVIATHDSQDLIAEYSMTRMPGISISNAIVRAIGSSI